MDFLNPNVINNTNNINKIIIFISNNKLIILNINNNKDSKIIIISIGANNN